MRAQPSKLERLKALDLERPHENPRATNTRTSGAQVRDAPGRQCYAPAACSARSLELLAGPTERLRRHAVPPNKIPVSWVCSTGTLFLETPTSSTQGCSITKFPVPIHQFSPEGRPVFSFGSTACETTAFEYCWGSGQDEQVSYPAQSAVSGRPPVALGWPAVSRGPDSWPL